MEKHPAVWKAEPGNMRAKNDRELCFYKDVPEVKSNGDDAASSSHGIRDSSQNIARIRQE